ncbi:MAG: serine--tRNA ligase [Bacteroidales bacterium]|jgi:seryl-tRNA synthetase|nr:serine--tRNA ligase [Bacteroidales bacterium]
MIPVQLIKERPEYVIDKLAIKNFDAKHLVEEIMRLDDARKATQKEMDDTLADANRKAAEIGKLFKEGKTEEANALRDATTRMKASIKELEQTLDNIKNDLDKTIVLLPNLPHRSVPRGKSAEDNEIVFEEGVIPALPDNAEPHWDLAAKYHIIDFELGNKVTGAGFPFYCGKGARLQRALINFFLTEAGNAGYEEYQPPLVVNEESGFGTGQLPDKDGQMYHVGIDNFYLIPTAEVPITNIYRNVILKESDFPVKNVAYSACFRREAGSYGKDVRGLNRLHQFDKVEIVQIAHPESSYQVLEEMKQHVAGLLRKLELPFRILRLCGGDMSFTSALTFDFEVYSAAQQRWLEVSSVSNFEDYQANRLKCRFKDTEGKNRLVHTLNGSALALPRIVAALLENNQTEDGIKIPKALQPFTGFEMI